MTYILMHGPHHLHAHPCPTRSFNYVNEVNAEVEKLEDQTTVIRREIGAARDGGAEEQRARRCAGAVLLLGVLLVGGGPAACPHP